VRCISDLRAADHPEPATSASGDIAPMPCTVNEGGRCGIMNAGRELLPDSAPGPGCDKGLHLSWRKQTLSSENA